MILMRLIDAGDHARAAPSWSRCSTPSMRKRTRSSRAVGLEVDVRGALLDGLGDDRLTSLMTGASSADSRRSTTSASLARPPPRRRRLRRRRRGG